MLGGLNSSTWPVLFSLVVAILCIAVALRETRLRRHEPWAYLWPLFWVATALVLVVMAVGQAGDVGQFLADIGRRDALANDWYERRRSAQTVIVAGVTLVWALTALIAIWRVPERRRRYLPVALVVLSLVCYGTIRVISLHHVDALVYRRHLFGAEVGRLIELTGISVAFAICVYHLIVQPQTFDGHDHDHDHRSSEASPVSS